MQISALKENFNNENRVALTPDTIKLFQRLGLEVLIEDGAGNNSGYPNDLYKVRLDILNLYQQHLQLKLLSPVFEKV